jgi:hypothetical protein
MTTTSNKVVQPGPTLLWQAIHHAFAAIFGLGAFVHAGFALGNPGAYRNFADGALFGWVYDGWQNIFMAEPRLWALLLGAGELLIAALLIFARRLGYVAVIAFHLALMLFGWGFWLWCVPALAFAVPAAIHQFRTERPTPTR